MKKSVSAIAALIFSCVACGKREELPAATEIKVVTSIYPRTDTFFGQYTSHYVRRIYHGAYAGQTIIKDSVFDGVLLMQRESRKKGIIEAGYSPRRPEALQWFVPYELDSPEIIITSGALNPQSGQLRGDSLTKRYISYNGSSASEEFDTVYFAGKRVR